LLQVVKNLLSYWDVTHSA